MKNKDEIEMIKKTHKVGNKELGEVIEMTPDAFRMSVKRDSLSNLELKEIKKHFPLNGKSIVSEKQEKLNYILNVIARKEITAYEIFKNTTITEAGVSKIIQGKTTNPNRRTVNEIYDYLYSAYGEGAKEVEQELLKDRLQTLIDRLELTPNGFAELLGERAEKYYKVLDGSTKKLSNDTIQRIKNKLPDIDINWLNTGVRNKENKIVPLSQKLPYYDIDATATQIEVYSDAHEEPAYYMSIPAFSDCNFACNVYGDSMFPMFQSGEVIVCKEQNSNLIQYGEVYLIITNEVADNLRTIKKIRKFKSDDSLVTLSPSNPNFDSFEIPKKAIIKLYLIKGKIKRNTM